ncbi:helix-turn-helix domain-containing protein [Spiribacter sp. C176]|uniref:Helix-turn-helix domain-containing protein n=1 Tax=Spiribacter salilacus TaxID=2664894 RepID=A0A6N7QP92_9GAMM|nr:Crp/Fnr family transcriptional regulator [Spiribacter salilacus]MRH78236.1 helix-turn-helix domain-containing protein [Spiribacter salilacus]
MEHSNAQVVVDYSHPALSGLDELDRSDLFRRCRQLNIPAGTTIFGPGEACAGLPLIIKGAIRLQMSGVSGNEIVLYRLKEGDVCPLSLACLFGSGRYDSEAIAEEDSHVLLLAAPTAQRLIDEDPVFRRYVLESYGNRMQTLMGVVEEVAFGRLSQRLAERLLNIQRDGVIHATHQALAAELGTAREVISRLLKDFERKGLVQLERGKVELIDIAQLEQFSNANRNN